MPAHLTQYLVMLPLLAWRVGRRGSRQFGRQPIRRKRMIFRIVMFSVIGAALALSGFQRIELAEGLAGGVLIGAALGLLGLRLTRFEVDPVKGDCYVPNPWIGALLTVLLLARLGWRLMVMLPQATAQLEICTCAVATMVPVRSLMMMRAGTSGVILTSSNCATKSTGLFLASSGIRTCTEVESNARAEFVKT